MLLIFIYLHLNIFFYLSCILTMNCSYIRLLSLLVFNYYYILLIYLFDSSLLNNTFRHLFGDFGPALFRFKLGEKITFLCL